MERWQHILKKSLIKADQISTEFDLESEKIDRVIAEYPARINPHFMALIQKKHDPIYKQVVPDEREILDDVGVDDPLNEEGDSPVPSIVHRYKDRALLMVTNQCAIYCRFCTRKRLAGKRPISKKMVHRGIDYIRDHKEIKDVILSGGDPLILKNKVLEEILERVRDIPHIEIIRIGTRIPNALPQRITKNLCRMLKKYHPLYMNINFIHPREITGEVTAACNRLADAGIPLGSQTVLLKGINDDLETIKELMQKLIAIRVKPYYLYQADLTRGTEHMRTSVECGLDILRGLQGQISGFAIPKFIVDLPGGGGKVALLPSDTVIELNERELIVKNYENKIYRYPQVTSEKLTYEESLNLTPQNGRSIR
ncbi:MAG: KamA family radical SAM protein [Gammaproteobacteria bacterium]|nr:KamA family radical SAM protein [Gammaproteobacteria bacterium]